MKFVKIPKRGDIVVKTITDKAVKYIDCDTYVNSELDTSVYEVVGVVANRRGKEVLVVYKNNASKVWCSRVWWNLTGYDLEGTSKTGTLSIRTASNNWSANVDKVIDYSTATTIDELVSVLNSAFDSDSDMKAQEWIAENINGIIRLSCKNIDYRQSDNNKAKNGFTLSGSLPEISALANMRRKNGATGGEGSISNWYRALAYFRHDLTSGNYNPNKDVTSIKRTYPVTLPAYLGTSATQSDHCQLLRSTYGEGEVGWLKFMESCLPVYPTDYGNMGIRNGKELTALMASIKVNNVACCPASDYAYNVSSSTIDKGEFWLPTTEEVAMILDGVQYGTNSSRNADILNASLNKISGTAISNGSHLWSCLRYITNLVWCANSNFGFFGYNNLYGDSGVAPVSLYKLA